MALIDELYSPEDCQRIKLIYKEDPSSRKALMEAFGHKIVANQEILTSKPLDVLALICMTADFASSHNECHTVAIIVHKQHFTKKVFPLLMIVCNVLVLASAKHDLTGFSIKIRRWCSFLISTL